MKSDIDQLVTMRDTDSLHEIMMEDDEWMNQLDAAEGLVKLGDRRGYDFLVRATRSREEDLAEVAQEIVDGPDVARMRSEIEAERRRWHEDRLVAARKRLQGGGKVFRYKMVYIPASELVDEGGFSEGYEVPALEKHGFEGWEIVEMLPSQRNVMAGKHDFDFSGAYFLFKKEVLPGEASELDR
jgi:plasmid stabilization system protein ParE